MFFGLHQKQKGPSVDKAMPAKKVFQNPETFRSKMIEKLSKLSYSSQSPSRRKKGESSLLINILRCFTSFTFVWGYLRLSRKWEIKLFWYVLFYRQGCEGHRGHMKNVVVFIMLSQVRTLVMFFGPHQKQKGPSVDKAMPTKKSFKIQRHFRARWLKSFLSFHSGQSLSRRKKEGSLVQGLQNLPSQLLSKVRVYQGPKFSGHPSFSAWQHWGKGGL